MPPFQKQVWDALLEIPFGETRTYQQLANTLGNPKAVRAVGSANGANQLGIIIPCHRVLSASGMGGYSGEGGLETKRALLTLEGAAQTGH